MYINLLVLQVGGGPRGLSLWILHPGAGYTTVLCEDWALRICTLFIRCYFNLKSNLKRVVCNIDIHMAC